jgi:hypothetical protein
MEMHSSMQEVDPTLFQPWEGRPGSAEAGVLDEADSVHSTKLTEDGAERKEGLAASGCFWPKKSRDFSRLQKNGNKGSSSVP